MPDNQTLKTTVQNILDEPIPEATKKWLLRQLLPRPIPPPRKCVPGWLNCGPVCRKDGEYESDLVYASVADCATGNWFWISWEPTGLVTLGQGHSIYEKVMTLNFSVLDL